MNTIEDEDGEVYIDPEEWLRVLLAITADEEQKQRILQKVSEHSGIAFENVEEVIAILLQLLLEKARSN